MSEGICDFRFAICDLAGPPPRGLACRQQPSSIQAGKNSPTQDLLGYGSEFYDRDKLQIANLKSQITGFLIETLFY